MSELIVSQRSEFECVYLFKSSTGEYQLNAHHYKVEVSVTGPQRYEDNKFIISFEDLKQRLDRCLPKNGYIFDAQDADIPAYRLMNAMEGLHIKLYGFMSPVSTESIAANIAETLQISLDSAYPGVTVQELKLRETGESLVTWVRSAE